MTVTLQRNSTHESRQQLKALFHSPLGVYVVDTEIVGDEIRLRFDIDRDDLDFTLHTLIATLPEAMIGPLQPGRPATAASAGCCAELLARSWAVAKL